MAGIFVVQPHRKQREKLPYSIAGLRVPQFLHHHDLIRQNYRLNQLQRIF